MRIRRCRTSSTDYVLQEVDPTFLTQAVKPKQFLHIDQSECILCEGCVDICPWKCIHMLSADAIDEAVDTDQPGEDPNDHVVFVVDEDVCTRCALCVDRCPTGVIILGKVGATSRGDGDPHDADQPPRLRLRRAVLGHPVPPDVGTSEGDEGRGERQRHATGTGTAASGSRPRSSGSATRSRGSQAWNSIFRPGSVYRKGYTDSPRNRSYVIMNNVLYHLHPVKVKRHAVKVSYTLCLGGLSLLLVHPPDRHRHLLDVLLPADVTDVVVERHQDARDRGDLRLTGAQHAPMGGAPHGALGLLAHGARLLPRRLQVAAGVQLGDRRHPVDAHPAALVHRLPAALGPARAVGGHRRHEHDGLHAGVRQQRQLRAARVADDRRSRPCCDGTCCTC